MNAQRNAPTDVQLASYRLLSAAKAGYRTRADLAADAAVETARTSIRLAASERSTPILALKEKTRARALRLVCQGDPCAAVAFMLAQGGALTPDEAFKNLPDAA